MQEKNLGELIFARIHAGPVFALARIQEIIFEGSFPHMSQILEGIHLGANTCRACIRTRANTGKHSWRIIYVLVSCQGVISARTVYELSLSWAGFDENLPSLPWKSARLHALFRCCFPTF